MNISANFTAVADRHFFRKLWQLALPVSLQSMMFSLLGLVDILMVGQLGETSVAAVGLGNRIFFFNLILVASLGSGMTVLASQFIGAGDTAGLRRTLCQALLSSMAITVPFIIIYLLFPGQILGLASDDPELLNLAVVYLIITAPSMICTAIVVPLESALRAANDARTPTRIGFLTILVNAALNYVLIFGAFGFPELGVAGSAWGTTLSRVFQTVALLWVIKSQRRHLIPTREEVFAAFRKVELFRYYRISLPMILQDGLWSFGLIMYNLIYASIGINELAVMSAISSVEAILISLFIGFGVGCSIIIGQELGADRFDKAWKQGWFMMLMSPVLALMFGLIIILFKSEVVSLFGQFQGESISMAEQVLVALSLSMLLRVVNLMGIIGILRSGGDVGATVIINTTAMWGVGIPLAWYAATQLGMPLFVVYICSLGEELSKSLMVLWRVFARRWLKNLVAQPEKQSQAS